MKRIKEEFLDRVEEVVSLKGKRVLEIGCGNGARSSQISKRCASVVAIEPNRELIDEAKKVNPAENIEYQIGSAEKLDFEDKSFDVAIFTLSLHHVPASMMSAAIDEAVRVTKEGGHIIFLEPATEGTFFEAELSFDACDGDEREEKQAAYDAIKRHGWVNKGLEIFDETVFKFESVDDFISTMKPKKNMEMIADFLENNDYILRASRRINIFKV
ncbi:MAG: class I SAM-dependent methyltransferase [Patescibacteria group bacterium]